MRLYTLCALEDNNSERSTSNDVSNTILPIFHASYTRKVYECTRILSANRFHINSGDYNLNDNHTCEYEEKTCCFSQNRHTHRMIQTIEQNKPTVCLTLVLLSHLSFWTFHVFELCSCVPLAQCTGIRCGRATVTISQKIMCRRWCNVGGVGAVDDGWCLPPSSW